MGDSHTHKPTAKGNINVWFLFPSIACESLAFSKLSWACVSNFQMTCYALMSVTVAEDFVGRRGSMTHGLWPICSWKVVKLIHLFMVFIRLKQIFGKVWTQPNWLHSTWYLRTWLTVLFMHSLAPSFSGGMQWIVSILHQSAYGVTCRTWIQTVYLCPTQFLMAAHFCSTIYQKKR